MMGRAQELHLSWSGNGKGRWAWIPLQEHTSISRECKPPLSPSASLRDANGERQHAAVQDWSSDLIHPCAPARSNTANPPRKTFGL